MNPVLVSAPAAAGNFVPEFPSGYTYGRVWWFNDTPYGHLVGWDTAPTPAGGYYVPAFHHRLMTVRTPINQVYYAVPAAATLSGSAATPLTYCRAEFYALDELGTLQDGLWPLNERLSNVGNTPGVTVLANQLGTTTEGVTTRFNAGGIGNTEDIFPYTGAAAARGVGISHLNADGSHPATPDLGLSSDGSTLTFNGVIVHSVGGFSANTASFFDNSTLNTDGAGHVSKYAGLVTAGQGVPPVVADTGVAGITVTAITQQTILSFTPAANGMYRIGARLRLNNGTSGQTITLQVSFTDADSGIVQLLSFFGNAGGATLSVLGALAGVLNGVYGLAPLDVKAKAGTAITVIYRDAGGTPNDIVNANMQWLS